VGGDSVVVYGRHLPELREKAEQILREEDAELRWMSGANPAGRNVRVEELGEEAVGEWTDGSRIRGRAAGAARGEGLYLGTMATVADAEEVGMALAWEKSDMVALDSQGVIHRIRELMHQPPWSWIEEKLVGQMVERLRRLMWVRRHQDVEGNEGGDIRAKQEAWMGERMHGPDIVTPAGIRQAFPLHSKTPAHLKWSRDAIRGLRYLMTDEGPQRRWMKEIGKVGDEPRRMQRTYTGARAWGMGWEGRGSRQAGRGGWCVEVARFLR